MTDNTTPRPWSRNIPPATKYNCIFAGRNKHVAYVATRDMPDAEIEANCDLIVRAVNAHDDLVAALEAMISAIDGEYHGIADIGRAALAKARA